MTQLERQTLEKLNSKLDLYIESDKKWKEAVSLKLTPLVEERNERLVLQRAVAYFWKGIGAIVLFIGAVGVMVHYLPEILRAVHLGK